VRCGWSVGGSKCLAGGEVGFRCGLQTLGLGDPGSGIPQCTIALEKLSHIQS